MRRRDHARPGLATIEAALLMNLLVLLLAGVLEFSRVLEVWVVTKNAAREGARLGAMGAPIADVQNRTVAYLSGSLTGRTDVTLPTAAQVTVTGAGGAPGSAVSVSLAAKVQIVTPLIQSFFPQNPMPVKANLTMRIQ